MLTHDCKPNRRFLGPHLNEMKFLMGYIDWQGGIGRLLMFVSQLSMCVSIILETMYSFCHHASLFNTELGSSICFGKWSARPSLSAYIIEQVLRSGRGEVDYLGWSMKPASTWDLHLSVGGNHLPLGSTIMEIVWGSELITIFVWKRNEDYFNRAAPRF